MGIFTDVWAGIRELVEPTEGLGQSLIVTAIEAQLAPLEDEARELVLTALHTAATARSMGL